MAGTGVAGDTGGRGGLANQMVLNGPEGIAVDAAGNVFTAEAQLRGVTKYVR